MKNFIKSFVEKASIFFLVLITNLSCAQPPADRPKLNNPDFDKMTSSILSFTVPLIGVEELNKKRGEYIILDAREKEEYAVSHIPGAKYIGYDNFVEEGVKDLPRNKKVVVYCSVGYRSEKIGEKLKKMGFDQVENLYGSIFEWANEGYTLEDEKGKSTNKVHAYNKTWSQWVENEKVEKVW